MRGNLGLLSNYTSLILVKLSNDAQENSDRKISCVKASQSGTGTYIMFLPIISVKFIF